MISELGYNVLLLDHLYLFYDDLEVYEWKAIEVLKEHPEASHGCTIDDLHELGDIHIPVALIGLVWHVALVSELLEHVRSVLMALVAAEKCTRLLTQC